jgi:hypothetical protein
MVVSVTLAALAANAFAALTVLATFPLINLCDIALRF